MNSTVRPPTDEPVPPARNRVMRVGHRGDDAGEDDQRRAVADARLGDELAEPHDDDRAGRQREDGEQAEAEARVRDDFGAALREALDVRRDEPRLDRATRRSCRSG